MSTKITENSIILGWNLPFCWLLIFTQMGPGHREQQIFGEQESWYQFINTFQYGIVSVLMVHNIFLSKAQITHNFTLFQILYSPYRKHNVVIYTHTKRNLPAYLLVPNQCIDNCWYHHNRLFPENLLHTCVSPSNYFPHLTTNLHWMSHTLINWLNWVQPVQIIKWPEPTILYVTRLT